MYIGVSRYYLTAILNGSLPLKHYKFNKTYNQYITEFKVRLEIHTDILVKSLRPNDVSKLATIGSDNGLSPRRPLSEPMLEYY